MRSCGWHASRRDTSTVWFSPALGVGPGCATHVPSHPIPLTHPIHCNCSPPPRAVYILPPVGLFPRSIPPTSLFILSLSTINHSPTGSVLDRTSSSDLSFSLPSPSPPLCNDIVASHGRGYQDVRWQCRLQQLPFVNPGPTSTPISRQSTCD